MSERADNTVVIGNGCAGAECIKALRESGYRHGIQLVSDSRWPIYNPMLTTYYASGKIDFAQLFPYGTNESFCARHGVDILSESPVVALDAANRVVTCKSGRELNYDQCLIATGASPLLPPISGIDSARVHVMRSVEDAVRLRDAMLSRPQKALVVGASMVGIKVVELFHKAGMAVCLADLAEHIFPLAAHPDCATVLENRLLHQGIRLRFGAGIERLEEGVGGIRAYFAGSDESEEADIVVMCIGVRANTGFIDRTQVALDRGVLVDERMQTNVPGLYAAGDVAQGQNLLTHTPQVIGLLANARYQGRTAGRSMAGKTGGFPGSIPHNITHFMDMDFVGIGDTLHFDSMKKQDNGTTFVQLFWTNGLLTGANFIDRYTESGVIRNALIKGVQQQGVRLASASLPVLHNLLITSILSEVRNG